MFKSGSCRAPYKPTTRAQRQARPTPFGEGHAYRLAPSHQREAASGAILSADRPVQPDGQIRHPPIFFKWEEPIGYERR